MVMHCALIVSNFQGTQKWRHILPSTTSNMSASISELGASPPKPGRPRTAERNTKIRLRKDTFQIWVARKDLLGFSTKTHRNLQ